MSAEEIDIFLRSNNPDDNNDEPPQYSFGKGFVNVAKRVGSVTESVKLYGFLHGSDKPIMAFVFAKGTKFSKKKGSNLRMLCVDESTQTTFNFNKNTAPEIDEATKSKITTTFHQAILDAMLPSKMATIRLLAIVIISALVGGAIVYQYYNIPDPALYNEFLKWKAEVYGKVALWAIR